jgi:hypothetical protein
MHARLVMLAVGLIVALCPMWPTAQTEVSIFFGNLHSHTALSDGSGTPAEAYEHARDVAGLDFLAITEHNHAQAGDIANNHALYTGPGSLSLIPTPMDSPRKDGLSRSMVRSSRPLAAAITSM